MLSQCHVFLREELAPPVSTGEIFSEIRYHTVRAFVEHVVAH